MRASLLGIIAAFMMAAPSIACDIHGKTGIVEDNNLWLSHTAKSVNDMTEEKFNEVLDRIEEIYAPIFKELGKTLQVERSWENGTVNAYAQQRGNTWIIRMFGGLARHETITVDAFATVACHEIGHHIGGAPKKAGWGGRTYWASNEGQADYWGTMKCLRKYMEKDQNRRIVAKMEIPELVSTKCRANFNEANDIAMCERGSMAGLSLGNLFRALRNLETELKFDTPDANVVTRTNHNHPAPQCRLDTYFAGALCDQNHYDDVSQEDEALNVCTRASNYEDGLRPLCWYKAPEA